MVGNLLVCWLTDGSVPGLSVFWYLGYLSIQSGKSEDSLLSRRRETFTRDLGTECGNWSTRLSEPQPLTGGPDPHSIDCGLSVPDDLSAIYIPVTM